MYVHFGFFIIQFHIYNLMIVSINLFFEQKYREWLLEHQNEVSFKAVSQPKLFLA